MPSGGSDFNDFPGNQLTKFKLCPPQLPYFCAPPRIFVTHLSLPGVPLVVDIFFLFFFSFSA